MRRPEICVAASLLILMGRIKPCTMQSAATSDSPADCEQSVLTGSWHTRTTAIDSIAQILACLRHNSPAPSPPCTIRHLLPEHLATLCNGSSDMLKLPCMGCLTSQCFLHLPWHLADLLVYVSSNCSSELEISSLNTNTLPCRARTASSIPQHRLQS